MESAPHPGWRIVCSRLSNRDDRQTASDPPRKRYGFDHLQLADATRGNHNDYVDWLQEYYRRNDIDPGMAHGVSANGWVGRPHHLPEEQMHTFWCIDRALSFLQKRDPTVPFFLNISFIDPHPPLTPPAHYYQRYIHRDIPPPVVGDWAPKFEGAQKGLDPNAWEICLDDHDMRCARAAYYGMINFIDDQIGRLIQYTGGLKDCLVIFTSDHGEMLGDHNLYRKTWPLRSLSTSALSNASTGKLGISERIHLLQSRRSTGHHAHYLGHRWGRDSQHLYG